MCLVGIAWRVHPRYPLIILANREEFHVRPTAPAAWWPEAPGVLGGRDLVNGGSWFAVNRSGRVALVINHATSRNPQQPSLSRGGLVREWLTEDHEPSAFLDTVQGREHRYAGFSLVIGDLAGLQGLVSPAGPAFHRWTVPAGITTLSNCAPETPWPKVGWLKASLAELTRANALTEESLFELLNHRDPVARPDAAPSPWRTTPGLRPFVVNNRYGTRSSTVLMIDDGNGALFAERGFDPQGLQISEFCTLFPVVPAVTLPGF
ncbi:hypothetical protein GPROT2_00444 [Gammaproteobacteria bacterium]|nr:hypothetical protein GPROT2_00444 [Gammaproteobacteria bacterium]